MKRKKNKVCFDLLFSPSVYIFVDASSPSAVIGYRFAVCCMHGAGHPTNKFNGEVGPG